LTLISPLKRKSGYSKMGAVVVILTACALFLGSGASYGKNHASDYEKWDTVGKRAADESLSLMSKKGKVPQKGKLVVLTNAGYAEVNGASTQGALDGLTCVTGATRGRHSLVEIHSAPWTPLWFAVYDKASGFCSYLQVDPSATKKQTDISAIPLSDLFYIRSLEKINADYLYGHATEFKEKLAKKVFGGNEFRIVSIANGIAEGAPAYAVRVLEFHDHFCPGVASGILMANYLKRHFKPEPGGRYFVHTVEPWCKEDAMLVLLNATPGKRGYAASYPTKADKSRLVPEARGAATIVYRRNNATKTWEGLVLAFEWPETTCPKTGNPVVDKLCADLWYLKRLEAPEDFVKLIKAFELPQGVSPKDWARPGVDPLRQLGLLQE